MDGGFLAPPSLINTSVNIVHWGSFLVQGFAHPPCLLGNKRTSLAATDIAFAALRDDGTVVCWGDSEEGGSCEAVEEDGTCIQTAEKNLLNKVEKLKHGHKRAYASSHIPW